MDDSGVQTCPRCGSTRLFTIMCEPPAPHFARVGCSDCATAGRQSFLRWLPPPMTAERAAGFRMPFGRYADRPLAEIPTDYLVWVRDNLTRETILRPVRRHLDDRLGGDRGGAEGGP